MRDVVKIIAAETYGESYQAKKVELDLETETASRIDSRESVLVNPKSGETVNHTGYVSLEKNLRDITRFGEQIFTYFLDGSRHIYKIDDIAYSDSLARKMVYPIVAGQIAVGCCRRRERKMFAEEFLSDIVIALPDIAKFNGQDGLLSKIRKKINDQLQTKNFKVEVAEILRYSTSQAGHRAQEFEDRAISKIQEYLYTAEQNMVAKLVSKGKLNQKNFLIKDGSLEYHIDSKFKSDKRKLLTFKNNFGYVIGVSKKFNPSLWTTGSGKNPKPNPGFIAELPLFHEKLFESFCTYRL
ncbi:MAG: hypothetical protein IJU91_07420 [Selenomonadaceae bacterium]|nr:hypothetical protein [Selenomonadaceae bacterium]